MADNPLMRSGRAWVFGDNVAIDGDLMALEWALKRETDPQVLRQYVFEGLAPDFAKEVTPGDVVFAGRRFAQGNPHIQGLIGLVGCGVGIVVESIPSGSFRNALCAGLPMLPRCPGIRDLVADKDQVSVDFRTGRVVNTTRGTEKTFEPLPDRLLAYIEAGGWRPIFERRLEQAGIARSQQTHV
jgi:3-isopropylmalate/(R)-2-methylmalate dehydratase small subunit